MEITIRIPDDLAQRFGTAGDLERRTLEILALADPSDTYVPVLIADAGEAAG